VIIHSNIHIYLFATNQNTLFIHLVLTSLSFRLEVMFCTRSSTVAKSEEHLTVITSSHTCTLTQIHYIYVAKVSN